MHVKQQARAGRIDQTRYRVACDIGQIEWSAVKGIHMQQYYSIRLHARIGYLVRKTLCIRIVKPKRSLHNCVFRMHQMTDLCEILTLTLCI